MSDPTANTPAAGWYPHPAEIGTELYWDGSRWTEQTRPAQAISGDADAIPAYGTPPTASAPPATPPATYGATPTARNGLAIAALVLGIVSVVINSFFVPSVLAIVFGLRGRANAALLGGSGRGMATAGLVLGILGAAFAVIQLAINSF